MTKFSEIIKAIKETTLSNKDKDDALLAVKNEINHFIDYFNQVVQMEIHSEFVKDRGWQPADEYIFKSMDETRRDYHNICVQSCYELNKMCENLGLEPICDFDIENRHEVANFGGYIVCGLYAKGIGEEHAFEKAVQEFAKYKITADQLNSLDSGEIEI